MDMMFRNVKRRSRCAAAMHKKVANRSMAYPLTQSRAITLSKKRDRQNVRIIDEQPSSAAPVENAEHRSEETKEIIIMEQAHFRKKLKHDKKPQK